MPRAKRGADIAVDLSISFEDSIFGTERKILLSKVSYCSACKGSGAEPNSEMEKCPACQGAGRMHESRRSIFGAVSSFKECSKCAGKGTIPTKSVPFVPGAAFPKSEEIAVKIPPGIRDGEAISLPGLGEAVVGGVAGDLYVKFTVGKHPVFKREGLNLIMDLDVKISEAMLGVEKRHYDLGRIDKIKGASRHKFRRDFGGGGKGVPQGHGLAGTRGRGDLMIKIIIRTPRKISKKPKI